MTEQDIDLADETPRATPGQVGYEAYRAASDGRSLVSGQALPAWEGTRQEIRTAWESAATAVLADQDTGEPESVTFADQSEE